MAKILLVDDDEMVRYTLSKLLSKAGHAVLETNDGTKVQNIIESDKPDILLTDIIMPNQEGIETISIVRQSHPELPIIAMSGGGRLQARGILQSARMLGANACLEKPFDEQDLLKLVDEFSA